VAGRIQSLGEVAAVIFAGMPTKLDDATGTGPGGNLLTVRSLTGTEIDRHQLQILNVEERDVEKYRVHTGDVLISARSTSLKTAIVPVELDGNLINATLIGVRCLPTLLPRLLVAWLTGAEGQSCLEAVSQSGTHQMNITVAGLSRIPVPLPNLDVQRRLVQFLEVADEAHHAAIAAAEDRHKLATQVVTNQLIQMWNA
jgi:hypothetical protein